MTDLIESTLRGLSGESCLRRMRDLQPRVQRRGVARAGGSDGVRPPPQPRDDRNSRFVSRSGGRIGRAPASTMGARHAAGLRCDCTSWRISEFARPGRHGPCSGKLWSQRRPAGQGQTTLRPRECLLFRHSASTRSARDRGVNKNDRFVMNGYCFAQTHDLQLDCLLPGIFINTSSTKFRRGEPVSAHAI